MIGPFQQFFKTESGSGGRLMLCAAIALAFANSPWAAAYEQIWSAPVSIALGSQALSMTVRAWINEGLMALFFLLVGLEIKREYLVGELASPRLAALPIGAAIGGMIVPAGIYLLVTSGTPAARGWAIPMATDIAFSLGVLTLVAPRAPVAIKVFLSALAIVDDLGAVVVIALFYSDPPSLSGLAAAAGIAAVLMGLNAIGVRRLGPYLALGVPLWWFVHDAGLHATLAGVILALAIPSRSPINAGEFSRSARALLDEFDQAETGDQLVLTSKGQQHAVFALQRAGDAVMEPLLRLEHQLHGLSAYAIMPAFALANAGVALSATIPDTGVGLAVLLGLAVGKPLGITLAAWLVVRAGLASLPASMSWRALHGCAWLGGIGFTMSIFVATLSFDGALLAVAKASVMAASLVAGTAAAVLLRRAGN